MIILKAIKSYFRGSYDKQNLTLVVISHVIYVTRRRLVSQISYEMTTRVRTSIFVYIFSVLSLALVYLVTGVLVNKLYRKESGKDVIPNVTFWSVLPGLIKVYSTLFCLRCFVLLFIIIRGVVRPDILLKKVFLRSIIEYVELQARPF